MGFGKITKKEKRRAQEQLTAVLVEGPQNAHYLTKPKKGQEPVVFLGNNRTLIQTLVPASAAPRFAQHQHVSALSDAQLAGDALAPPSSDYDEDFDTTPLSPRKQHASPTKGKRHKNTQAAQSVSWQRDVIPALIPVFVRLWYQTKRLRDADTLSVPTRRRGLCGCANLVVCRMSIVRFTKIEDLEIDVCQCTPAPQQLLKAGLFPCAPHRPTMAVDARLLELAMKFVRIAPNNTAWTGTLESFLEGLGFTLKHEGSLRRLFGSALEWYTHLRHKVDHHFDDILEVTRVLHLRNTASDGSEEEEEEEEDNSERETTPVPPTPPGTPATPRPITASVDPPRGRRRTRVIRLPSTPTSTSPSTSPTPVPGRKSGKKRAREPTPEPAENPFEDPPRLTCPSEYLRSRCPACFGGLSHDDSAIADCFVCIDACFTQKRNKSDPDPPKTHPHTHFVPESLAVQMEEYVDCVRGTKSAPKKARKATAVEVEDDGEDDCYEHERLRIPRSVLDGCEASFKAADERREKASVKFYDDTALMALLCRHDRVLWLVNMHSAGEKQFNALLLLETLFQHLPPDINVGLLYDIACQLERSALKWGFLARYFDRLAFAVAIFHAFGHDWACQLIYNPRKRPGFGFTNGEGCERLWHAISGLIAHLRISSYHHRLYTLDTQIRHIDEANLFKLAEWNHRRALHSTAKRVEARELLRQSGHSVALLRKQWEDQVKTQTKPLARRSKTKGQKAIEGVLGLREALAIHKEKVVERQAEMLDAIDRGEYGPETDHKANLDKAKAALEKAKTTLRRKEQALGVDGRNKLKNAAHGKYFQLRMNAYAVKRRLRDLLRAHKFERDGVERTSRRHQASENKLRAHTDSAIQRRVPKITRLSREYNELCTRIATEIRHGRTPRNCVAPDKIETKELFQLDVDDAIWQDVGLGDDEEIAAVPLWLSSQTVRSGIRAMLELDRADEEDSFLKKERSGMRAWFAEEWAIVNTAMNSADSREDRYQFHLRRERLLRLCLTWRKQLPAATRDDTPWGPTDDELFSCQMERETASRGEDTYEERYGGDSDDELEDYAALDAIGTADAYRGAYDSASDSGDSD
ncbi:hypothetical protein B0H11DRAFT_2260229 [Mycena galericulata]|nr:hypothetical protein B0H11DRAFT_2260229 [Mycena galericulata]